MKKILFAISFFLLPLAYSSASAESSFKDVQSTYPYAESIQAFVDQNIVKGYPDNTFKPNNTVNRVELLALLYRAKNLGEPLKPTASCFPDVAVSDWFSSFVCAAKKDGIVKGAPDGNFHPADTVTLPAAAKMIVGMNKIKTLDPKPGEQWYAPFIQSLSENAYIPTTFTYINQEVTRGELVEILWRVNGQYHDKKAVSLETLQTQPCQPIGDEMDSRFDMNHVRATWFGWINDARKNAGLATYTENAHLDRTAVDWAKSMRDVGVISHRRTPTDPYYDYNKITEWFADRGVVAKNVYTVTHTENIGGGYLNCKETDCTDELITAIRPTFDGYMNEKNKPEENRAHYNSIMNKYFQEVGFGLALSGNRVFSATHYITELTSKPAPMCVN